MDRTIRVAFLVTAYPSEAAPAACVFHRTFAEALHRAGIDVEVVAPLPRVPWPLGHLGRRWRKYSRVPRRYRLAGIEVDRPRYWQVPRANLLTLRHGAFARCLETSLHQAPDLIHAHFAYPCGVAASIAAPTWRAPVVLTLHGSDVNEFPDKNSRTRASFVRAVRGATFVSAVSEALAARTEALTGRLPAVMPIGIDLRRYRDLPDPATARRALGLPADVRIVLYVGTLIREKGVTLISGAVERLESEDVLTVFVGDGRMRSEIAGRPRTKSVGAVPNDQVPMFMRAADVLVLPSFSEGMPTVLVEAGATGLAVVATSVGGVAELLGDNRGTLIRAGSEADLARAIQDVLGNREAARERSERLKEHIFRNYDADENARAMIRVYEALLEGPRALQTPGEAVAVTGTR